MDNTVAKHIKHRNQLRKLVYTVERDIRSIKRDTGIQAMENEILRLSHHYGLKSMQSRVRALERSIAVLENNIFGTCPHDFVGDDAGGRDVRVSPDDTCGRDVRLQGVRVSPDDACGRDVRLQDVLVSPDDACGRDESICWHCGLLANYQQVKHGGE